MPGYAALMHFDRTDCWIFDLDNTLYPSSANLFGLMDIRMASYVAKSLSISLDEARIVQKRYFVDHGTTLAGLMINAQIDPSDYLTYVHDVALDRLKPDAELAANIAALPGRKLIFTNADAPYARRVLERRGLQDCFEAIFDIHDADYAPKPDAAPYATFCSRFDVDPARAIMFEDMARNLRPAKGLGMGTVWINNGSEHGAASASPSFIDHETHDLGHWLAQTFGVKIK
jgi:putative hydrolase of the HAD superfamily